MAIHKVFAQVSCRDLVVSTDWFAEPSSARGSAGRGGLAPGEVEKPDDISIARMRDPDGNLIVLAQPGEG